MIKRALKWYSIGDDQPEMCRIGKIRLFKFSDGHVSCSVDDTWISALFESSEAALSWRDDWNGAEQKFREVNPNLVGLRV